MDGKNYIIEVYRPNSSERDILITYEADYPFPAVGPGHIIPPLEAELQLVAS